MMPGRYGFHSGNISTVQERGVDWTDLLESNAIQLGNNR
jgi:hypothetical protein